MKRTGEREIPLTPGTLDGLDVKHTDRYKWASSYTHGKKVYDIASGSGYGSMLLEAKEYTGFDNSDEAVDYANQYYKKSKKINFLQADASNMPSHLPKVDVIVSFETIEHITEPEKFLEWCSKHGQKLIISTPVRGSFKRSRFHLFEYRLIKFEEALKRFFPKIFLFIQKSDVGIIYPCRPDDKGVVIAVCEN